MIIDDLQRTRSTRKVKPPTIVRRSANAYRRLVNHQGAQDGATAVLDQAVVGAKAFLTGVIVGRVCTKEEFGLYVLAVSFIAWMLSIQSSLVAMPYMVYWPRLRRQERLQYGGSTLLHSLIVAAGAMCVLGVGSAVLLTQGHQESGRAITLALLGAITFIMLQDCIRQMAFAHMQMRKALGMDFLVTVTQLAALVALAWCWQLTVARVYVVVGVTSCLGVLAWSASRNDTYTFRIEHGLNDFRKNWDFGKWVLGGSIFWIVSMDCYPWLLAACFGTSSAAVWGACVGITALAHPLLLGIANYLGPRMAHVYSQDGVAALRRFVLRATLVYLGGAVPIAIGLIAVGWWLVPAVYGQQYAGHGVLICALAVSLLMDAVRFCCSRGLFAVERADVVLAASAGPFLALLPATIFLIRSYGTEGAAIAMLINNAVTALCMAVMFLRRTGMMNRSPTP